MAIKEDGFVASPYPIILSLEMHCGVEQQGRIARHLLEQFGKHGRLQLPVDEALSEKFMQLHSPADLQYKVLVKGKRVTRDVVAENDDEDNVNFGDEDAVDDNSTELVMRSAAFPFPELLQPHNQSHDDRVCLRRVRCWPHPPGGRPC